MGIADAFGREDRLEIKVSQFIEIVKTAGKYETMMNGINCDVPHRYLREMATGKREGVTIDYTTLETSEGEYE